MRIRILSEKEFVAGLLFAVIGLGWAYAATNYDQGTATQMGPGYFPHAVGIALAGVGLCSVIRSMRVVDADRIGRWPFVTVFFILLSVVSFALLLTRFGLVAASAAVVLISCYNRLFRRPVEALLLALCITGFVAGLFVYLLALPLKLY